jgi:hypothetical protein
MFKTGQLLHHPADFDNAMFFGIAVEVWQRGEILEDGLIQNHNEDAVLIDGGYFLKATCQFKVR